MVGRIIKTEACVAEGAAWLAGQDERFRQALEITGPLPTRLRKDGFDQTLEVSVRAPEGRELPKGFDCPSVTSEPKGDSAKSLKLKFNAAGEDQYQGPIQIFGRIISQDDPIEYPITLATFSLRPGVNLRQLWLNACSKPK